MNRRNFLKTSLAVAAAGSLPQVAQAQGRSSAAPAGGGGAPGIIDTNVDLFEWPFRRLKYGETTALVDKLRRHGVVQAWAGSFEALLHKNVDRVNSRLAEECRRKGEGFLVPFGTVVPAWPDWEEDLRRCHEVHRMPGIRLYPAYQGYGVDHAGFVPLLQAAGERGLLVQIALGMEDSRVHHPITFIRPVHAPTLTTAVKRVPGTRIQLLYAGGDALNGRARATLAAETHVSFDISRFESVGVLWRMLGGGNPEAAGDADFESSRIPLERILFGSHAPYFPLETALLKLFESPLTLPQMQAIMEGNARRLLALA
jgi:uncharacterized protein